ncbi:hypothetical protein MUK42_27944, partial [Musa troglodytarum]
IINFYLFHLSEDDIPLPLNALVIKARVLKYVRKDLQRLGHIIIQHLGVAGGLLPRCVSIQMTTHVLDLLLQLLHRPRFCALEDHVLQEVRGPGIDPHADGGRTGGKGGFGGDAETVGEGGDAGLRGGQDGGMVSEGSVGGGVAEEAGFRVVEALDLGSDGLGEAIVEHHGGPGRGGGEVRGGEGGGGRGGGGSAREEEGVSRESEELTSRHGGTGQGEAGGEREKPMDPASERSI